MQDPLARVEGVGSLRVFGAEYAMRIWMDPTKLASYALMPSDVQTAIEAQNANFRGQNRRAAVIQRAAADRDRPRPVAAANRRSVQNIIVKSKSDGSVVRLGDVARVEMGSEDYTATSNLNGHPAAGIAVMMALAPTRWIPPRA